MKNKFLQIGILILFVSLIFSGSSLAYIDEGEIKARWVYALVPYIKWQSKVHDSITICTRGLDRTYHYLTKIQQEKKSAIMIKEKGTHTDLRECQLLYVATSEINNVRSILKQASAAGVVTVSDIKGFAEDGGVIELVHDNNRVKLRINIVPAKNAQIIINSDLLAVSDVIGK